MKTCLYCGAPVGFNRSKYCSDKCAKKMKSHNEIKPNRARRYNITVDELEDLLSITNCEICNKELADGQQKGKRCIDHDHKTGIVRGVLCDTCNLALGHAKDSVELLELMIIYLKERSASDLC